MLPKSLQHGRSSSSRLVARYLLGTQRSELPLTLEDADERMLEQLLREPDGSEMITPTFGVAECGVEFNLIFVSRPLGMCGRTLSDVAFQPTPFNRC